MYNGGDSMICSECNSKFKLIDRVKSMIKRYGKVECSNCKSIFVEKRRNSKVSTAVCIGLTVLLCSTVNLVVSGLLKNIFVAFSIIIFVAVVLVPIIMFLSQHWTSYEKIN